MIHEPTAAAAYVPEFTALGSAKMVDVPQRVRLGNCSLRCSTSCIPAVVRAFALLSSREHEIFAALVEGRTVRDIAVRLHRSPNTVNNHRTHLMQKLKLRTTAELTRLAIRLGVVSP